MRYDESEQLVCGGDSDPDDNQPPALKYLDNGNNYPIVPVIPIDDRDHGHDHDHP